MAGIRHEPSLRPAWRRTAGWPWCSAGGAASTPSRVSPPAACCRASRSGRSMRWSPIGSLAAGAGCGATADSWSSVIADRALPAVDAGGAAVALPGDPTSAGWSSWTGGRRVFAGSTWCSRCCTDRSARTAPSRDCWRWPGCPTSGQGCWPARPAMDKEFTKKLLAAQRNGMLTRPASSAMASCACFLVPTNMIVPPCATVSLHELVGAVDVGQRLLQVDDVDAVALGEDVALHLRVPAAGLVPEVHAGIQ